MFSVQHKVNMCIIVSLVLSDNDMKYKPNLKIIQSLHLTCFFFNQK